MRQASSSGGQGTGHGSEGALPLAEQLRLGYPHKQGLYDPAYEHDACGVGFICDIKGRPSRRIIEAADRVNCCMDHRGGLGAEKNSGDGAGLLCGIPDRFFRRVAGNDLDRELPPARRYAAGNVFLPRAEAERAHCMNVIEEEIVHAGQRLLGWRELPVDPDGADVGQAALEAMPHFVQLFVAAADDADDDAFERALYVIRKHATKRCRSDHALRERTLFYICSLSSRVIVYKGMLTPHQVFPFYGDLREDDFESHLAMVHSRFSTNTFPSWDRAQPCRWMSHNGEINTLRGNVNWLNARAGAMSAQQGSLIDALLTDPDIPVVDDDLSDSGTFDGALELLLMSRALTPRSHDDDDPRGLGEPRVHAPGQTLVLRVPRQPHGALGRARLHLLHRRPLHRRRPRPQRPPPLTLLRHRRRPRHHGVRGGRAARRWRRDRGARRAGSSPDACS
jgi:glutamate synthase (NADPH/NADH) large chain